MSYFFGRFYIVHQQVPSSSLTSVCSYFPSVAVFSKLSPLITCPNQLIFLFYGLQYISIYTQSPQNFLISYTALPFYYLYSSPYPHLNFSAALSEIWLHGVFARWSFRSIQSKYNISLSFSQIPI